MNPLRIVLAAPFCPTMICALPPGSSLLHPGYPNASSDEASHTSYGSDGTVFNTSAASIRLLVACSPGREDRLLTGQSHLSAPTTYPRPRPSPVASDLPSILDLVSESHVPLNEMLWPHSMKPWLAGFQARRGPPRTVSPVLSFPSTSSASHSNDRLRECDPSPSTVPIGFANQTSRISRSIHEHLLRTRGNMCKWPAVLQSLHPPSR